MAYRRTPGMQDRLDATADRIVAAALALVAADGYPGCSVAAVAREADVATGTVYRHFPDKGALLAEVFRTIVERELAAVAAAGLGTGSAAERIEAMITTFAGRAFAAPRLAYALLADPVHPQVEAERLRLRVEFCTLFAAVVAQGVAAGTLVDQVPDVTAAMIVGALGEVLVVPLHLGEHTPDTVPALTTLITRALGVVDAHA